MSHQKNRLINNVLSNYLNQFVYGVSNFILVGYVVRKLGKESFGLVALLMSTIVIASLFESGITRALTKYVAEEIEKPGRPLLSKYISTGFVWYLVAGLVGASIMMVLGNYSENIFEIPSHLQQDARNGWYLMGLRIALVFPFTCFQGILHGYQRYDLVNGANNIAIIVRLVSTILFFEFVHASIAALLWIAIVSFIIERILWIFFTKRVSGGLHLELKSVSKDVFIVLLGFGSFIFIISVGNLLGYEAVKYVIGGCMGVTDVGGYTLIATVAVFAGTMVRSISSVLTPAASRLETLGQQANQRMLANLSTKYAMIVAGLTCVVPVFLLRPLLGFWVGDKYPVDYLDVLASAGFILLTGQWFISMAVCVLNMFTGTGRIRVPALVTICWACGGLLLSWLYINFVSPSLMAVVLIITVARVVGSIIHFVYGIRIFVLPKADLLFHSILQPLGVAVFTCLLSLVLSRYIDVFYLPYFVLVACAVAASYAIATWYLVLSKMERGEVLARLHNVPVRFSR